MKLKPFRQRPGYCGPASLKILLAYYGINKSEKELARLCKCTRDKGTNAENLVKAAKSLGLEGFIQDYSNVKDIKKGIKDIRKYVCEKKIPVIVDWFYEDDGHYSVVSNIDKYKIYLQDPSIGGIRTMSIRKFKRVWFDFPGDFIKSKDDLILRRLIVIYKENHE